MSAHILKLLFSLFLAWPVSSTEDFDGPTSWLRHCEADTPDPVDGILEGHIPRWVEGRLIRVGPGMHHIGDYSYRHMFDPLALLHMVKIQGGRATYTSRYLESETFKTNLRKRRIAVTEFGTPAYPDPCKTLFERFSSNFLKQDMGDNCLVNVLQAKHQLIAMTETDTVRVVDPTDLKVLGRPIKINKYVPVDRASAHPHVDREGNVYNLAPHFTDEGPGYSIISYKEGNIKTASVEASIRARWNLDPSYMHSFAITDNYYILIETPLALNALRMIVSPFLGMAPESGILWHPDQNSRFRVIKRADGEEIDVVYTSDKFFTFHHINAYEINDLLVVDICAIESGEVIKALYLDNIRKRDSDPSKMKFDSIATRYVLPIKNIDKLPFDKDLLEDVQEIKIVPEDPDLQIRSPSAVKIQDREIYLEGTAINDMFLEMPRINYDYNGKMYRYVYGVGTESRSIDFTSLIKLDVHTGRELVWSDPDYFVSEPVFLPEPGKDEEDSGVILTLLLHKKEVKQMTLLILDAKDFSETARVLFSINGSATPTFHGQFVSFGESVHGY